jgi:hypothetical protein
MDGRSKRSREERGKREPRRFEEGKEISKR